MNKVIMMGRLTRDPEVRYGAGASASTVGRFSIAVDRRFKREGQPDADFFNCTVFGKQAEFVEKYLKKGTKVVISGSLQNDNYTDKNGVQRNNVQIMVDEVEFAESKSSGSQDGGNNYSNYAPKTTAAAAPAGDGFMNIPDGIDEELPFS